MVKVNGEEPQLKDCGYKRDSEEMTVKRAKFAILLFGLVIVAGAILGMHLLPARGVKRQMEAIRTAGLPASPGELDVWYKAVPAKENRALLLVGAAGQMVDAPAQLQKLFERHQLKSDELKSDEAFPKHREEVAAYLEENKVVLEKVQQAEDLPGSRFPVNFTAGFSTLVPHLAQMKKLSNLLKLDAEYQARSGNAAAAYRSVTAGFAIAGAVRQEPIYISELVSAACASIAVNTLQEVLNHTPLNLAQLSSLSTILAAQEAEGLDGLYRGLVGERALGLDAFKMSFGQIEAMGGGGTPGVGDSWLGVLAFQAYTASGLRGRDHELYLESMDGMIDSTRSPFPEALRRSAEVDRKIEERFTTGLGRLAIITRMLVPGLRKGTVKEALLCANLRCAQMGLAVERYRADHKGALPASAEELSPRYLHKLPKDPFDDSALIYERLPNNGYRVLSAAATADRKKESKNAEDVAFTVKR